VYIFRPLWLVLWCIRWWRHARICDVCCVPVVVVVVADVVVVVVVLAGVSVFAGVVVG